MQEVLIIVLPIMGVALLLVSLGLRQRRLANRSKPRRGQARHARSRDTATREPREAEDGEEREQRLKRELHEAAAEIHAMSHRDEVVSDERTAMLEQAMRDAEARNAKLKETLKAFENRLER